MLKEVINKIQVILNRHTMRRFDKELNKHTPLVGVEIGVDRGEHAKILLKHLNIHTLYLIDPYESDNGLLRWDFACKNLKKFKNKISWCCGKSEDVADYVPTSLDFIYDDGDHHYKTVKKNLELYYPRLKEGGVYGGHDFNQIDVAMAVIEFVLDNKLTLQISRGHIIDWWIVKK